MDGWKLAEEHLNGRVWQSFYESEIDVSHLRVCIDDRALHRWGGFARVDSWGDREVRVRGMHIELEPIALKAGEYWIRSPS